MPRALAFRRLRPALGLTILMAMGGASLDATARPAESARPDAAVANAVQAGPIYLPLNLRGGLVQPAMPGGSVVIAMLQEPDSLYLYGETSLAATQVRNALYDGPVDQLNYDFQPVILTGLPRLEQPGSGARLDVVTVERGERYVDQASQEVITATAQVRDLPRLTARFSLRPGMRWQDGVPVTASDSVFSQRLDCGPDTPTSKDLCERTAHYDRIDDGTVEWQGLPGYVDSTFYANFYTPLPRHQPGTNGQRMDAMEASAILEDEVFARRPLSYGPFMLKEWVPGKQITLVRNPAYWRAAEGMPFLDRVDFRFMSDADEAIKALLTGDAQVVTRDSLNVSQIPDLEAAAGRGRLTPYYFQNGTWEHIDFNHQPLDGSPALGACKEVRQAIAHGTDRQGMVDTILHGKSTVQNSLAPDAHWSMPPAGGMTVYGFDPDKARNLLQGLGFVDADGDGYRETSKAIHCPVTTGADGQVKDQVIEPGTPLALTLVTTKGSWMREDIALRFQADMQAIGVKIELLFQEAPVLFGDGPDGTLYGRSFDLAEYAWLTGVRPPVDLYRCGEIPSEDNHWAGQNPTGWCSPEYDQVTHDAMASVDRGRSLPLYHRAHAILADQLPALPLFGRVSVIAAVPTLLNLRPDPSVSSETWNIEEWRLGR